MYKIVVSDQCGCFRMSGLKNNQTFTSKDEALMYALEMKDKMNEDFCGKHLFEVQEMYNNFIIKFYVEDPRSSCCGNGCCD